MTGAYLPFEIEDMCDRQEMFGRQPGSPPALNSLYSTQPGLSSPASLSPASGTEGSASSPAGGTHGLLTDDGEPRRYESPPIEQPTDRAATGYQPSLSPFSGGIQQTLPANMYTIPPATMYSPSYYSSAAAAPLYQESLALLSMGSGSGYPPGALSYAHTNYYNPYPAGYGIPSGYYAPEYQQTVPTVYASRPDAIPGTQQLVGDPYCLNCFGYLLQGNCIYCNTKAG